MKYPFIQAWGARLGSFKYYIDGEIEKATEDGAPQNAIYRDHDTNKWCTIDDVSNIDTRQWCEDWVAKREKAPN
jgi:hypothetical protein